MSYQWWTVLSLPDGSRRLRNHATGRCLDDSPATGLRAVPCGADAEPSQTWVVTQSGDEAVEVRSRTTGSACTTGRPA